MRRNRNELKERRKLLYEMRNYAENQFDKLIVYLASGGLSFSILLSKDSNPKEINNSLESTWLLWIIWISFVMSIVTMLISHIFSKKSIDKELIGENFSTTNLITVCLNYSSLLTLIMGIIFLLIFSGINHVK